MNRLFYSNPYLYFELSFIRILNSGHIAIVESNLLTRRNFYLLEDHPNLLGFGTLTLIMAILPIILAW